MTTAETGAAGFDEHFAALFRHAFTVAVRILDDRGDAEDVAIEATARAHLHWRRIGAAPYPWLTRVSANLAIDELRRRRRRPSPGVAEASPGADTDVDQRVDLRRIIETLPRRQRQVLVMHYFDDLTQAAIAAGLQTTAGTVKQHHARGLAALRKKLGARRAEDEVIGDE
jgi:RNA polymerase sigma factor (sigma-70 family)